MNERKKISDKRGERSSKKRLEEEKENEKGKGKATYVIEFPPPQK